MGDIFVVFDTLEPELPDANEVDSLLLSKETTDLPSDPTSDSRISDTGGDESKIALKSTLVPKEVLEIYHKAAKKLRKDLAAISLEVHEWYLKSYDHNEDGIVKIYCMECMKDSGGTHSDHSNGGITNLCDLHICHYYKNKVWRGSTTRGVLQQRSPLGGRGDLVGRLRVQTQARP
jgi:hypothetical protein